MEFATLIAERVSADPSLRGADLTCECCGAKVILKAGEINKHHFAHLNSEDCDPWSRGKESEWHRNWKAQFPAHNREVVITKNGVSHRADVQLDNGIVLEFQHSPISPSDMADREDFYENMIWVFDAAGKGFENATLKNTSWTCNSRFPKRLIYATKPCLIGSPDNFFYAHLLFMGGVNYKHYLNSIYYTDWNKFEMEWLSNPIPQLPPAYSVVKDERVFDFNTRADRLNFIQNISTYRSTNYDNYPTTIA